MQLVVGARQIGISPARSMLPAVRGAAAARLVRNPGVLRLVVQLALRDGHARQGFGQGSGHHDKRLTSLGSTLNGERRVAHDAKAMRSLS